MDRATFLRHLRATYEGLAGGQPESRSVAAYFRFLTLLGFKVWRDGVQSSSWLFITTGIACLWLINGLLTN